MLLSERVSGCLFMVLWIPQWFSSLKKEEMDVCNQAFLLVPQASWIFFIEQLL